MTDPLSGADGDGLVGAHLLPDRLVRILVAVARVGDEDPLSEPDVVAHLYALVGGEGAERADNAPVTDDQAVLGEDGSVGSITHRQCALAADQGLAADVVRPTTHDRSLDRKSDEEGK